MREIYFRARVAPVFPLFSRSSVLGLSVSLQILYKYINAALFCV